MERNTRKGPRALRVVARNERRAIERAVKDMFANQDQLVLPILSLVTEARAQIEDVLGEVNREILENLLFASAEERAGAKTPGRAWGEVRWYGTQGGRVPLGDRQVCLRRPRVRDRSDQGLRFRSSFVPPYVRRSRSVEAVLPWLYLKGVSTGDMREALAALVGKDAAGLSAAVVSRLKARWAEEYESWKRSPLGKDRWVYLWADGIYSGLRADDQRLYLLVVIGVNERGQKRFLAIEDGVRESAESWRGVLRELKDRGLKIPPKLAAVELAPAPPAGATSPACLAETILPFLLSDIVCLSTVILQREVSHFTLAQTEPDHVRTNPFALATYARTARARFN